MQSEQFGRFEAGHIIFFKSDLKPTGPVYTPLKDIAIKKRLTAEETDEQRNSTGQRAARDKEANKEKAIDMAVSQIEKQFGKGAIMRLGCGRRAGA